MSEYITYEKLSKQESIPIWKLKKIKEMFFSGIPIINIARKYGMYSNKTYRICSILMQNEPYLNRKHELDFKYRYYKDEEEMLIQDYKAEDLKGDELEILNNLK